MAAQTRSKKSTLSNTVEMFRTLSDEIAPPIDLTERELFYYKGVITAREMSTWTLNDKFLACNLAQSYAACEALRKDIKERGFNVINERGTPVSNPSNASLSQQTSAMQSLCRMLGIGASQRGLSGSKQAVRNNAENEARKVLEQVSDGDFFA